MGSKIKSAEGSRSPDATFKPFYSLLKQYDIMLGNKIEKAVESVDYK